MSRPMEILYQHASGSIGALDEHTLLVVAGEDAREEDVAPFFEVFDRLAAERAPAQVLVDATRLQEATRQVRWAIARRLLGHHPPIERSAVVGLPPMLDHLLWVVFSVSGRSNVRTLLWRHEARQWLDAPPE